MPIRHHSSEHFDRLFKKISEEPYRKYWHELGRFVHTFAFAESRLLSLLRDMAGMTNPISGVIFSGTRIDTAKDLINRICEVTDQTDRKNRLERPLAQFSAIATIRNNIIHWGAQPIGRAVFDPVETFTISNAAFYPSKSRFKEFVISLDDLTHMIADLQRINFMLLIEAVEPGKKQIDPLEEYLREPWLYTPPQPSPQPTKPRRPPKTPKQKRQRRASQTSR